MRHTVKNAQNVKLEDSDDLARCDGSESFSAAEAFRRLAEVPPHPSHHISVDADAAETDSDSPFRWFVETPRLNKPAPVGVPSEAMPGWWRCNCSAARNPYRDRLYQPGVSKCKSCGSVRPSAVEKKVHLPVGAINLKRPESNPSSIPDYEARAKLYEIWLRRESALAARCRLKALEGTGEPILPAMRSGKPPEPIHEGTGEPIVGTLAMRAGKMHVYQGEGKWREAKLQEPPKPTPGPSTPSVAGDITNLLLDFADAVGKLNDKIRPYAFGPWWPRRSA